MPNEFRRFTVPLLLLLLAAAGLMVYGNTFQNNFVYDDEAFIVNNQSIRTLTPVIKYFDPNTSSNNTIMNRDLWRPLTTFSYALNYAIFGLNTTAFHVINVIFHIINALLVFWLVILIVPSNSDPQKENGPNLKSLAAAFIASLIFLIHPVQSETVAWVSQRSNLLFLFFFILAFIAYIYNRQFFGKGSYMLLMASYAAFILSLLSKEMAVSMPIIIFTYEYILGSKNLKESLKQSLSYFAIVLVFILIRSHVLGQMGQQSTYWGGSLLPQILTMVKGFGYYVRLMFVPYPLNVEYLFPIKYAIDAEVLIYGSMLVGIIYLGFRLMRSHAMASFGIFLFFFSLVPVSNLLPMKAIINERFLYLSVAGFGMVLGQIAAWLTALNGKSLWRKVILAGLICLIVYYGVITICRNLTWRDQYTFTVANLHNSPQSAVMHFGMGKAFASRSEFDRAVGEFELCLRIDPQYADVLDKIEGNPYKGRNMEDLIERYRQSVQKRVDLFEGLSNLGVAYFNKGEYGRSARILEKAAEIKPGDLENRNNLACAYAYAGDLDKAIKLCKYILSVRPDMLKTRYDLGLFYGAAGMPQEAKKQFQIVLEADPNNEKARNSLENLH